MQLCPCNPPRAPHSRPPSHAGLASVLQAASFGAPEPTKESQATSTREMDPWKTTRDRFVPASTVLISTWNDKTCARVAGPRLRYNLRTGKVSPQVATKIPADAVVSDAADRAVNLTCCQQYPHFAGRERRFETL